MAIYKDTELAEQPIYGSSRLGQYATGTLAGTRTLGNRHYELSNHLGNVLAVITDNIYFNGDSTSTKLITTSDYYPFGLDMKGRSFTPPPSESSTTGGDSEANYRYGFNGKERDNNLGGGTHYDYGFRIYKPRIAKFLSVDPLAQEYPWYTPYQFAGNRPINSIDLDGLEELVTIYDYTVDIDNPALKVVDYRFTHDGVGPLGLGSMIIKKYRRNVRVGFISPKSGKSFNTTIDPAKYVNPPSKLNDESIFVFESKVKVGIYAAGGATVQGLNLKLSGGSYAEILEAKRSERGRESTELFSKLEGAVNIGPITGKVNPISGDYSGSLEMFKAKSKITWNPETGSKFTSTATGEEDVTLFSIEAGVFVGAEFSLKLNNPLRKYETTKWNKFLRKLQYDNWNQKRIENSKKVN